MIWNKFLLIYFLIISIDSRKSLRDYVVLQNNSNGLITNDYSIYDSLRTDLICRLKSLNNNIYNPLSNLILYPSQQTIASIRNVWSSSLYEGYFNVLDDQLNKWIKGEIIENSSQGGFKFTIKYGNKYYIMENKLNSLITQIRDAKKPNYILTDFYRNNLNPFIGSSIYNIQIYTNDLPDPIYILALYALDSTSIKRRIRFIPLFNL